ncbi:WD repeat-containing protein 6 [Saitoella coloradoensis]
MGRFLESIGHVGPVTALSFAAEEHVLVGQAGYVKVYNLRSGELLVKRKVFVREKVHGIVINRESRIIIHGGRSFCVTSFDALLNEETEVKEYEAQDWILDGTLHGDIVGLVVMHNSVLFYNASTGAYISELHAHSVERSVLYAADVRITSSGLVRVAAGTVMNEILLWHGSIPTSGLSECPIEKRLNGHDGVIFGLDFTWDGRLLVSCSDDRSVRVWDTESGECLATGWGHGARIWDVMWTQDEKSVVTASEDTDARLWGFDRDQGTLETKTIWDAHTGKHCWCAAVGGPSGKIVATGGQDGRVRLFELAEGSTAKKDEWTMGSIYEKLGLKEVGGKKGPAFKSFVVLDTERTLLTTSTGQVLLHEKTEETWTSVCEAQHLVGYSEVRAWRGTDFACIGDRTGGVTVINTRTRVQVAQIPVCRGQITDLFAVSLDEIFYVVLFAPKGEVAVLCLEANSNQRGQQARLTLTNVYSIKVPDTFEPTSATVDVITGTLFLGSKQGAVSIQRLGTDVEGVFRRVHGMDAVTSITIPPRERSTTPSFPVLTTGKDGSFAYHGVSLHGEVKFIATDRGKIPSKGQIDGAITANGELLLYGFRTTKFFVYNHTRAYEVYSENCGGAHRAWSYWVSEKCIEQFVFAYTKASVLSFCKNDAEVESRGFLDTVLQDGTHGREVRTTALSFVDGDEEQKFFASGGEDAMIHISRLDSDGRIQTLCRAKKHVAGLQSMEWTRDNAGRRLLFSSAGLEELIIWSVWADETGRWSCLPIGECPKVSEDGDLRVMDFDVKPLGDVFTVTAVYSDSTIRMWMCIPDKNRWHLLAQGTYRTCCLLQIQRLQVGERGVLLASATDGNIIAWDITKIAAEEDAARQCMAEGTASEFNSQELPAPIWTKVVHQSSVKVLETVIMSESDSGVRMKTLTGGDDNALVSCIIDFRLDTKDERIVVEEVAMVRADNAHGSCVTGIVELNGMIVSVAIDQQVKFWELREGSDKLQCVDATYTQVADCGGLMYVPGQTPEIKEARLIINGVGMEVMKHLA